MPVVLENKKMRLTIGDDASVCSLILIGNGEELLDKDEPCRLCSVIQKRPYNNEVKLAHPNKRTTFDASSVRQDENDKLLLHLTFETVPVKADIRVTLTDEYMAFEVEKFDVTPEDYGNILINIPPVCAFRLLQLPVRSRECYGEWMNVMWDDKAACAVMSATPYMRIDSEARRSSRIMYAEVIEEYGLTGKSAVLVASEKDSFLDCVDRMEQDYGLPRGVQSRRSPYINASCYWVSDACPANIDEHIRYAKMTGMRMMLFYYTCIFKEYGCYSLNGNYDYRDDYPDGRESVRLMLEKVKKAGLIPGIHFLHTHIGLSSRYVTPKADPRLHLTRNFTLARALADTPDEKFDLYVYQNPAGSPMSHGTQILKFGTELISYEGYETTAPYRFTGCMRGDHSTDIIQHSVGEIGGILDVSEYGAGSCYIDQNTDLQDEIADKIADAYSAGFEFIYFDGSEGAIEPFEIHVPAAQYRVIKKLPTSPIYCEGAAKAHFSWHFLSGGNAFDVFEPSVFKQKIAEHPLAEAPRMACDFTRLNFGWWFFWDKLTQPDHYEFATSRAAAWDCPATMMANLGAFASHPRTNDIFEVLRRWEDVRANGWLTDENKELLKSPTDEHHLLINEKGEYELVPVTRQRECAKKDERLRVFVFERAGRSWAMYWHSNGSGYADLPIDDPDLELYGKTLQEKLTPDKNADGTIRIPVDNVKYISSSLPLEKLIAALRESVLHTDGE